MDRPLVYNQAQGRDYDVLWGWREALYASSMLVQDILGQTGTVVSGLAATPTGPTSLTVNIAAGRIYQQDNVDTNPYGSLVADTRQVMQQGTYVASTVTLSTSGLSAGQSRWALIQATFSQADIIPGDDPNGGLLPFLNSANPSGPPYSGPNNSGSTLPTRRAGQCNISVIYGAVAATGTEVPPSASANSVGLYLIDLAFGQTTISSGQILVAGPSVGTGVPSNYPRAPFLAGLLNSHHDGLAGQAPQINLATEVQGVLPAANVSRSAQGSISGETDITDANYTITQANVGQRILLNPGATANRTFTLNDGVNVGDSFRVGNSTTGITLSLTVAGGSAAHFFGLNFSGVSTIPLLGAQEVWVQWTGSNWHVAYFTGVLATTNNIGSLALVTSASQLTQMTSYTGGTFTGFSLTGNWLCITSGGPVSSLYFSLIYRIS